MINARKVCPKNAPTKSRGCSANGLGIDSASPADPLQKKGANLSLFLHLFLSLALSRFFCICADGLQRRLRQCSSKCTVQCAYTRADSLRLSSVGPRVLQRSCFPTTKIHRHVTAHANQHSVLPVAFVSLQAFLESGVPVFATCRSLTRHFVATSLLLVIVVV